jgi:hypothetical protein
MKPIIDPRDGDIEDDASSTKRRSLFSLAGSLLVEISLPKLVVAWTLLIGVPGLLLGMAPLLVSLWIGTVSWKASTILTGIWPLVLLLVLAGLAWFARGPRVASPARPGRAGERRRDYRGLFWRSGVGVGLGRRDDGPAPRSAFLRYTPAGRPVLARGAFVRYPRRRSNLP